MVIASDDPDPFQMIELAVLDQVAAEIIVLRCVEFAGVHILECVVTPIDDHIPIVQDHTQCLPTGIPMALRSYANKVKMIIQLP